MHHPMHHLNSHSELAGTVCLVLPVAYVLWVPQETACIFKAQQIVMYLQTQCLYPASSGLYIVVSFSSARQAAACGCK